MGKYREISDEIRVGYWRNIFRKYGWELAKVGDNLGKIWGNLLEILKFHKKFSKDHGRILNCYRMAGNGSIELKFWR